MTTATLLARAHDGVVPEDDPALKPTRRRFSAACKLVILEEYEQLSDPDAKGALLRREGLYSSHLVEWRRARDLARDGGVDRHLVEPAEGGALVRRRAASATSIDL
ncbi:MAG: hypothetical protein ACYCXA_07475 [Actinomycetes bacterium]